MTVVAIDGPAGSGKSTIAAALARRLGVAHVDTGAYYRAATLAVLRAAVDLNDPQAVVDVVAAAPIRRSSGRTLLDSVDVEDEIRGPAVTAAVSAVAAYPGVRKALLELQRSEVPATGGVVEGRDAGTVVVPDADVKVWLTATVAERALRRVEQRGITDPAELAASAAALRRRDASDAAQMARAGGAVEVDTTGRTVDEIVDALERLVRAAASPAAVAPLPHQGSSG